VSSPSSSKVMLMPAAIGDVEIWKAPLMLGFGMAP
jgi:hypothetical protein